MASENLFNTSSHFTSGNTSVLTSPKSTAFTFTTISDENLGLRTHSPLTHTNPSILTTSTRVGTASEASASMNHRSKFHPLTFHHSHFSKNIEKDTLGLFRLKQALFPSSVGSDQSFKSTDIRSNPPYAGEKVLMRTGSGTVTRDSRVIAAEKEKRRQLVSRAGFSSTNHETYKPLGEPILDPEKLIANTLNVAFNTGPSQHGSAIHSAQRDFQASLIERDKPKHRKNNQVNVHDGFDLLHEKLIQAKRRLQSIKFGIPLAKTLRTSTHCQEAKPVPTIVSDVDSFHDWTPQKLDREKMLFYLRYITSPPAPTSPIIKEQLPTSVLPRLTPTYPNKTHLNVEEMEHALRIQRPALPDPVKILHQMRSGFNKEKQRLAESLKSQLLQVERERAALIFEKYRVFQVGMNGICDSDLERMRLNATQRRKLERQKLLKSHPWYNSLIKLVYSHDPLKKTLSEAERALLYQLRIRIGDHVVLDKKEFVDMIKVVPSHDFMKEEVQKIIKFLKLRIGLTELEYLDAIEMSGQMLTTTSNFQNGHASTSNHTNANTTTTTTNNNNNNNNNSNATTNTNTTNNHSL